MTNKKALAALVELLGLSDAVRAISFELITYGLEVRRLSVK
jgi:hypothetical protein